VRAVLAPRNGAQPGASAPAAPAAPLKPSGAMTGTGGGAAK